MSFNYHHIDLPVTEIIPDIQNYLKKANTLVVHAPPGAGKSTLIPLTLMDEEWLRGKKIIMLEPRRLAARAVAARMAFFLDESVGKQVGYRVRFDTKVSAETRIEVVTEGILTRMLQSDNALEDVGLVIFDEFHERSIHADISLALCRESQQLLRPDLKIMVMSATLNMPELTHLLDCPSVSSEGKMFPVTVTHTGDADEWTLAEQVTQVVQKAVKDYSGDVLVFLPGQREIHQVESSLKSKLRGFSIHPLYGSLPLNVQQAAIMPNKNGNRKIVLATNIAETSLTIEGITIVVDCGYERKLKFDPKSGLTRLETQRITLDAADQRSGRAGRLMPGHCYRMWSKATHLQMGKHRIPEIAEADLAGLVLEMANWSVSDINKMCWLTPPPKATLVQAYELLHQLEALEDSRITAHGKKLLSLPCHPRLAHMLVCAEERESLSLATDIAALLEERDPLGKDAGIDINERIEALRKYRRESRSGGRMALIEKVAANYRKMFDLKPENGSVDPYETGILITFAYPERIACARPGNNAQFQLSNGALAMAGHRDDLAHEPWLAVAHLDARDGMGKIFLASPLNPRDLAPMVKERENIGWDNETGNIIATLQLRIGSIVLKSSPLPNPDSEKISQTLLSTIQRFGTKILDWNEQVTQWQNRILSLRLWNPDQHWRNVETSSLLDKSEEWLGSYLTGIKNGQELKKLNIFDILYFSLEPEQQQLLDQLAPENVKVPSGFDVPLNYRDNGDSPILSVRIQELFGLSKTPTVNDGKIPVLIHLLSPGFKPVQVTTDLESFWNSTYFEVKKELKRRYPKHVWPDDPWNEPAIRGVKRKS